MIKLKPAQYVVILSEMFQIEEQIYDSKFSMDIDRVYTTLRQIVRDWSSEGASERASCYGILIAELKNLYPDLNRQLYKKIKFFKF